jgi:putative ABC transport system permease protein
MLELAPIIKSLWRSKIGPLLIIVQLALSIAIVSNALFFIQERIEHITRPTGFAHTEVSRLMSRQSDESDSIAQTIQRDIAVLEGIPGIKYAAPISRSPFGGGGNWTTVTATLG